MQDISKLTMDEKIARINVLYHKSKKEGLTDDEKAEQQALRKAYEQPFSTSFTDDASVMEAAAHKITLIEGERHNIKITTPSDMIIAEAIIAAEENDTQL